MFLGHGEKMMKGCFVYPNFRFSVSRKKSESRFFRLAQINEKVRFLYINLQVEKHGVVVLCL